MEFTTALSVDKLIVNEVVTRATTWIDEILKSSSQSDVDHSQLIDVLNLLNKLREPNSSYTNWSQLFCRRLKRLMDYNDSLRDNIWLEWYNSLLHIIKGPNHAQDKGNSWKQFLEMMKFEAKLQKREFQFQKQFKERMSLSTLFCKHRKFFKEYLDTCILLHSKVQVQGLIENIDDLLCKVYGLSETSLTTESKNRLQKKLKCIDINFDCLNRSLDYFSTDFSVNENSSKRLNNSLDNFLPSVESIEMRKSGWCGKVAIALRDQHWIVILGDPGSAKTTLLRWITRIFAEEASRSFEDIVSKGDNSVPVRIPILIRIGEFATWLQQYPTKKLIDYIGNHTWFSKRYCSDEDRDVLKTLIDHGHALILLDGLDEFPEVERRHQIINLIREFIGKHVRTSDFISAFDHAKFHTMTPYNGGMITEIKPPNKSSSNQIIVTSRIVGYQLHPLKGTLIKHYLLLLMDHNEANKFVKNWMSEIEKGILDVLKKEEIIVDRGILKTISNRRYNTVQAIFEKGSKLLLSNPLLLSVICTFIFQLSDEFYPKSRVELYDYAVKIAMRFWTAQESNLSKHLLTSVLIDLATYLHLNSPSGLIDEFDMEHLCFLTLEQRKISNNRTVLREYVKKLISLLESNVGIIAERGLQIFGFLHLSFQEYFVAQALVKRYSIDQVTVRDRSIDVVIIKRHSVDEIAKRILSFTINPRFRESLLLAVGWISLKWSFDDYDKFCNLLITPSEDYAIPFGTFLFFDAINDMQRLPSNSIIFTALNNLLNHRSNIIGPRFLFEKLSQLPDDIIIKWMQLYLKDDKSIFKFCHCLLMKRKREFGQPKHMQKSLVAICQQLWMFNNRSTSVAFVIDQTLRRTIMTDDIPGQLFNKEFSAYFCSDDNDCVSNIHPLILSAIIAVCGGVHFEYQNRMNKISFSLKYMHRESSILAPIIKYLDNKKESNSITLEPLIDHFHTVIEKSLPSDTSCDVVDTFIALICLQGCSEPSIYQKYEKYQALLLVFDRFKWIWFYFNESCNRIRSDLNIESDISFIESEIEPIMNMFFPQSNQSNEQYNSFSLACVAALKKLRMLDETNSLNFVSSQNNQINKYSRCQSEFIHIINEEKLDKFAQMVQSHQVLKEESFFILSSLSQCLTYLEDLDTNNLNICLILSMLQSLLHEYMLENYALVLFREKFSNAESLNDDVEEFLTVMRDRKLLDLCAFDEETSWKALINIERQRICNAKDLLQNQEKDIRFFAASISLARLFQAQYRSRKYRTIKEISLSSIESKEIHLVIINILNPMLRIIAFSIILDMKDPTIFNEEQRDKLRWELVILLQYLLPRFSLLISTVLFVRCHTIRQFFPVPFQHMAKIIGKKLNETSDSEVSNDQQEAYIALRQLNNSDLFYYLSDFAKRANNLSDLLHFNSTIFYRYFKDRTSFDSSNTILLSSMYLVELSFDVQNLKMDMKDDYKNNISHMKELEQLWIESSKNEKIMTMKVVTWITNYLQMPYKENLRQIIGEVSHCQIIEKRIITVIDKWLNYRKDKILNFFAHYAALQLVIEGSDRFDLIDIIEEMFSIDNKFHLKSLVERLFDSSIVNLTILREILIRLHRNVNYFSIISVWIDRKEVLQLILHLEFERVTSNVYPTSEISSRPFLLTIKGCSEDLQVYLEKHVSEFINGHSEEYVAIVVKWIIENSIGLDKFILSLLHDQQFPKIQKAIVNGLNSVFLFHEDDDEKENIFMQNDTMINLETMICSWNKYLEDVVSICLLAYGNCLIKLNERDMSRDVSDEIKKILTTLSCTSSSEIICVRANFCLIFAKHSYVNFSTTLKSFRKKSKNKYTILLQQTLYETKERSFENTMKIFVEYLEKHSDQFIDIFLTDLYNYLDNRSKNNYIFDPSPDYLIIALQFSKKNWDLFRNAIQKQPLGEIGFKNKLILHYTDNSHDWETLIELYACFGILTIEIVDILKRFKYAETGIIFGCLRNFKQVSDRDVVEKLFELFDLDPYDIKFTFCIDLLVTISRQHAISLLEVHRKISRIMNVFYDQGDEWRDREKIIFHHLLNISCFNLNFTPHPEKKLLTEHDIDEVFDREIEQIDKQQVYCLKKLHFPTISDSSN